MINLKRALAISAAISAVMSGIVRATDWVDNALYTAAGWLRDRAEDVEGFIGDLLERLEDAALRLGYNAEIAEASFDLAQAVAATREAEDMLILANEHREGCLAAERATGAISAGRISHARQALANL